MNRLSKEAAARRKATFAQMLAEGKTYREIAEHEGVSYVAVFLFCKRHGLKSTRRGYRNGREAERAARMAKIEELAGKGMSAPLVARMAGLKSASEVYTTVRASGKRYHQLTKNHRGSGRRDFVNAPAWQVADPSGLRPEDIKAAREIYGVTLERMAWLLSCPRGGRVIGWRGGAAIG